MAFKTDGVYLTRGIDQTTLLIRFELDKIFTTIIKLYKIINELIDAPNYKNQVCSTPLKTKAIV